MGNKEAKKTLNIELKGSSLKFDFNGPWTGKDVTIVWRNVYKQYKLHKRDIRRKSAKSTKTTKKTTTKKGGK